MSTGVPKRERERTRETAAQGGIGPTFLGLQMEEGELSSGMRQALERSPKRQGKLVLPYSLQVEHSPSD